MKTCNKCILTDAYPHLVFNEQGTCSMCAKQQIFEPYGEPLLLEILEKAKAKKGEYDALVPLSGGKDSTYILHLAVNVYKLKVLTMTFDNGFVSQVAHDNMEKAINITGVKHIVCKPDTEALRKIYRNMLLLSGDFCGACGIPIKASMFKIARDYRIPIILLGTSPLEEDSFLPDTTQDIERFKYIMKEAGNLTKKEIRDFLIYPNLNYFKLSVYKRLGIFPKEVCPLFYIPNPSDKEMGEIISKELGWMEEGAREYTKHFDCIAEQFTNYVRHNIYGYERRICQYSTMVRRGEITREKAEALYHADHVGSKPGNYDEILSYLNITDDEMKEALSVVKPLKYEKYTSVANKLFAKLMKLKQKKS